MCARPLAWLLKSVGIPLPGFIPIFRLIPEWWGTALCLTYIAQAAVSLAIDNRFEKKMARSLFWVVWYPVFFWILQALTAVVGLPKAIHRIRHPSGTWISPDRGIA
jgi:biofilm PGA synthesis N-glycosyltransferase PgaC